MATKTNYSVIIVVMLTTLLSVSVRAHNSDHQNETDIVSITASSDICATYLSCTACGRAPGFCVWCLTEHRCHNDYTDNCTEDAILTSMNRYGASYYIAPWSCPGFVIEDQKSEILVPAKSKKSISGNVSHLRNAMMNSPYMCQFNIEGRVTRVNATLASEFPNIMTCDAMDFSNVTQAPTIMANFTVFWDGFKPLENPYDIHVVIYQCREMANGCGACLALDGKYKCGWCSSSSTCEVEDQCGTSVQAEEQQEKNWLNNQQTCPDATIHSPSE